MSIRFKARLIFAITILAAIGVYVWNYPLNKGEIVITTDMSDYEVITRAGSTQCTQDPCILTLSTGAYSLEIKKGAYFSESVNTYVKRGKTENISIKLRKIPILNVSPIIPANENIKDIPEELKNLSIIAFVWDYSGEKLVFLDQADNKLKIWEGNENIKIITTLKRVPTGLNLYWSPGQNYIFGSVQKDIYFINVRSTSRRKQILDFIPKNVIWSLEDNYLLANDKSNNVYKINFLEEKFESIEKRIDLNNAVWGKEGDLIFFTDNREENISEILSFNTATQEQVKILTKYNFPIGKIGSDKNNETYLYNIDLETWYKLDY